MVEHDDNDDKYDIRSIQLLDPQDIPTQYIRLSLQIVILQCAFWCDGSALERMVSPLARCWIQSPFGIFWFSFVCVRISATVGIAAIGYGIELAAFARCFAACVGEKWRFRAHGLAKR